MSNFNEIIGVLNDLLRESIIEQELYNQASIAARDIQHAWNLAHPHSEFDDLFDEETVETMHEQIIKLQQTLIDEGKTEEASHEHIMRKIHERFPTATQLQTLATRCRHYIKDRQQKQQKSGLKISCPINPQMVNRLQSNRSETHFNEHSDEQMCLTKCNHLFGTNYMLNWCAQLAERQTRLTCPECRAQIDEVYSLSACPLNQAATEQRMNSNAVLFDMMFLRACVLVLEGMVGGKHGGSRKTTKRNNKNKHTKNKVRKSRKLRKSRKSMKSRKSSRKH
jgi:hypothetical protein